jgi:hypothetical protein
MGNIIDSQIQQATQASQQVQINQDLRRGLSEFLSELEKKIIELRLDEAKQRDLGADLETIKAQLNAAEPKRSIIKEALSSIRKILEAVGADLLAAKATELLTRLG